MSHEERATIYNDHWDQISEGNYKFHSITVAVDNKCFFSFPLESNYCSYLEKVYAGLAQQVFKIDPTIQTWEVAFAQNFDDIWIEYASDHFNTGLKIIFFHELVELQEAARKSLGVLERVAEGVNS